VTVYTYPQLEQLWIQAGGPRALAPLMAAIALAESGGNSGAQNPSGAAGVWQINGLPPGFTQAQLFSGPDNARMAVWKYRNQGLTAWTTYTSGAYKRYYKSGVSPGSLPQGGGTGGGSSGQPAELTSFLGSTSGVLSQAGALLHGTAVVLDRVFGMFAPGQGWRLAFWAAAIGLFIGSYRAFGGAT
jgi:Lysozyme like domain